MDTSIMAFDLFWNLYNNNDDFISHIGYFNEAFRILFYNGSPEKTFSLSSTDIENLETQYNETYYVYFMKDDALSY